MVDAIVVMAKKPRRHDGPRELVARAALGALFWHRLPQKAPVICVEGHDLDEPGRSGADVVKDVLLQAGVSDEWIVARALSNCTAREVAAIRAVLQESGRHNPLVITHPYHVRRTKRYFAAAGMPARVVGCSAEFAREEFAGQTGSAWFQLIEHGEIRGPRYVQELLTEAVLSLLHTLDPQGRIERYLADRLRGGVDGLQQCQERTCPKK